MSTENQSERNWRDEIESIWNSFSVKNKVGANLPGGRKETLAAQEKLVELKREFKNDEEFDELAKVLDEKLKYGMKRHFYGPKFVLIGSLIGILFMFYMSGRAERMSGKLSLEEAESKQAKRIVKLEEAVNKDSERVVFFKKHIAIAEKEIEESKNGVPTEQLKKTTAEKQDIVDKAKVKLKEKEDDLEKNTEELEKIKPMTAEEYRVYKIEHDMEMAEATSDYGWKSFLWLSIIFASCFVPGYTINKREHALSEENDSIFKSIRKASLFRMFLSIMGSGQSVSYVSSDGSTSTDFSGNLTMFALGTALLLTTIILFVIFLPYIMIVIVIRNVVIPYLS